MSSRFKFQFSINQPDALSNLGLIFTECSRVLTAELPCVINFSCDVLFAGAVAVSQLADQMGHEFSKPH